MTVAQTKVQMQIVEHAIMSDELLTLLSHLINHPNKDD
jgi:hypothetical protein